MILAVALEAMFLSFFNSIENTGETAKEGSGRHDVSGALVVTMVFIIIDEDTDMILWNAG